MFTERKFPKRSDFLKLNEQSYSLKKIYEYNKKDKTSQNSTKIMIPKSSNFTTFISDFKSIKNRDINSIEIPKKSIKNKFLYSNNRKRNKNNNLMLSNFTNTTNSINSKKFNTMENRRNSSVNRIFKTKNTKTILADRNPSKIKLLFPKLSTVNSFKFINKEKYKTISNYSNGNNSNNKYILNNNNNSIFVSKEKSKNSSNFHKFNENKIILQKSIEFSLFTSKLDNKSKFFSPKKKSNLKKKNSTENINETEKCYKKNLINGFSSVENENKSKNLKKKSHKNKNYSDKKEEKNRIIKFRTILHQTPKSKKVRKSVLDFSTKYHIKDEKKDKSDDDEYASSGSNRLKSKNKKKDEDLLEKNDKTLKIIDFPERKSKTSRKESNYIKSEKIYLFKENKNSIISNVYNTENDENNSNRHINKKMTTKSCKNFTNAYDIDEITDVDKDNKLDDKKNEMNNLEASLKKSTLDMKKILCNYYINKDEEKYINKKRLKINKLVKDNNKSSHLYRTYTKEIKEYFYKNFVADKVTEKILDNFVPVQNNMFDSKNLEKEKQIFLKTIFNKILDKCHKNNYSFEEIIQFGKRILKNEKIEIKVNVKNHHILEMFDVYQTLYNQIVHKWNIYREQDLFYYKKMFKVFGSLDKKDSIRDFYIYKQHVKRDYIMNLDDNIFRRTLIDDINNRYKTNINISSEKIIKYNSKKNLRAFKVFDKKKIMNSINDMDIKRLSYAYENRGIGPDFNSKKDKKVSDESNSNLRLSNYSKLKNEFGYIKQKSFKKFAKMYRLPYEKNTSQKSKIINEANYEKDEHSCSSFSQKELKFNNVKKDLDNYNILKKNKKLFNMNFDNNENEFKKKYSRNRAKKLMNDKYKTDSIAIKIANFDQLTKVASVIKTQEIEKDNPDVKIFEGFVDALLTRKLREFDYLLKNEEETLDRNINRQELSTGNTLLMYATQNNLKAIVELLLAKGADTNIQNKFGNSALHIAYKNDNIFIINLLFEYGADQKLKNNIGLLPFQMSKFINS